MTAEQLAAVAEAERARLLALARHYASSSAGTQDIVQEAVLRAIPKVGKLKNEESAGAWLAGFVIRVGAQMIRTHIRRDGILSTRSVNGKPDVFVPSFADAQRTRELRKAMESLSAQAREIVMQRVVHENTVRETANALGIAEGTVKSTLYRSLRRLRQQLGDLELFAAYVRAPQQDGAQTAKEGY